MMRVGRNVKRPTPTVDLAAAEVGTLKSGDFGSVGEAHPRDDVLLFVVGVAPHLHVVGEALAVRHAPKETARE